MSFSRHVIRRETESQTEHQLHGDEWQATPFLVVSTTVRSLIEQRDEHEWEEVNVYVCMYDYHLHQPSTHMLTNDETDCGEWRRVYAYAVNGGGSIIIVIIVVIFIVVSLSSGINDRFYHQVDYERGYSHH